MVYMVCVLSPMKISAQLLYSCSISLNNHNYTGSSFQNPLRDAQDTLSMADFTISAEISCIQLRSLLHVFP